MEPAGGLRTMWCDHHQSCHLQRINGSDAGVGGDPNRAQA